MGQLVGAINSAANAPDPSQAPSGSTVQINHTGGPEGGLSRPPIAKPRSGLLGRMFSNLTNTGITDPSSGQTQYGSPAQNDARTIQTMPATSQMPGDLGSSVVNPSGGAPATIAPTGPTPSPMPTAASAPSFIQAMRTGPGGMPNAASPLLTTKGKILAAVIAGVEGGAAGAQLSPQGRNMGFGGGFETGENLPFIRAMRTQEVQRGGLENQQLQAQIPWLAAQNRAKLLQTMSEADKNTAQAGQATAQAAAVPYDEALKQAQAAAADVGGVNARGGGPWPCFLEFSTLQQATGDLYSS